MRFQISIWIIIFSQACFGQGINDSTSRIPRLGDHEFLPSSSINPFILTEFEVEVGFAQTDFDFRPSLLVPDSVEFRLDGELLFINTSFKFKHRIRHWIALFGNVFISSRIGTEANSLLSQGINTIIGFSLGWNLKLVENNRFLLTGLIELRNEQANIISISNFIDDVINGSSNPSISDEVSALTGGGGIIAGYGLSSLIGFTGRFSVNYGESFSRGNSRVLFSSGLGVDVNLYNKTNVPLGLSMNFLISSVPNFLVENEFSSVGALKIAYTGTKDFQFGIESVIGRIPLPDVEKKSRLSGATIFTTYYFK